MEVDLIGFIDRFEEDIAVVKCHGRDLIIPILLLPKDAKEGAWIEMNLKMRRDLEDKTREEVLNLLEMLKDKYDDSSY
ncbi:DUF3006 domain-containing protein [bacterium]|nr:DUF3006 domain-containing protein [bacterium]